MIFKSAWLRLLVNFLFWKECPVSLSHAFFSWCLRPTRDTRPPMCWVCSLSECSTLSRNKTLFTTRRPFDCLDTVLENKLVLITRKILQLKSCQIMRDVYFLPSIKNKNKTLTLHTVKVLHRNRTDRTDAFPVVLVRNHYFGHWEVPQCASLHWRVVQTTNNSAIIPVQILNKAPEQGESRPDASLRVTGRGKKQSLLCLSPLFISQQFQWRHVEKGNELSPLIQMLISFRFALTDTQRNIVELMFLLHNQTDT